MNHCTKCGAGIGRGSLCENCQTLPSSTPGTSLREFIERMIADLTPTEPKSVGSGKHRRARDRQIREGCISVLTTVLERMPALLSERPAEERRRVVLFDGPADPFTQTKEAASPLPRTGNADKETP